MLGRDQVTNEPKNYLYIDARYLRHVFDDRLVTFVGRQLEVNWESVKNEMQAQRVFYYDCVDDMRRDGESEMVFETRVSEQEEELDAIASLDGYFVRLGSMRGGAKKRRQKEVDVLLSVDMLTHSHRGITSRAIMIAGDLDFKPVVEAVVEQGTMVTVYFDPRSGARDLARAADSQRPLSLRLLWYLSTGVKMPESQTLFPTYIGQVAPMDLAVVKEGAFRDGRAKLMQRNDQWIIDMSDCGFPSREGCWQHRDLNYLMGFVAQDFGHIDWV